MALAASWNPPIVEELLDEGLPSGPLSHFPHLAGLPTFGERAVAALDGLLMANGELLPVAAEVGRFFLYNVTRVVDALDEAHCEVERFAGTGRIMHIKSFVFREDKVAGLSIFKIPQMPKPLVMVTDPLCDRVMDTQLTGFVFELLWESAPGGRGADRASTG